MKTIIICFIILLSFLGYFYFLFQGYNISDDSYLYTLSELSDANDKVLEIEPFLKQISSIKNLNDFKDFINKDSTIIRYDFNERKNHYKNYIFEFDSSQNLKDIKLNIDYAYDSLDDDVESYAPIISYLFSKKRNTNSYFLQNIFAWLFFILLLSLLTIINVTLFFFKKNLNYLSKSIIYLVFILLINSFQLAIGYRYNILDISSWTYNAGIPTSETLFKLLGIISHFQSIVFDANIISLVLLLVFILIYFRQNKVAV